MELIICAGLFAAGALAARFAPVARAGLGHAAFFLAFSIGLIALQLIPMLLRIPSAGMPFDLRGLAGVLTYAWHAWFGLVLALAVSQRRTTSNNAGRIHWYALAALSIYVAGKYVIFTVGKARHTDEMIAFFVNSGLPAWLHYFIMSAEVAGALGILAHRVARTGPLACAGLMIIMAGAVHTHWRNGDPFSDSHDAVKQLVYLAGLMALYGAARWRKQRAF